MRRVAQSVRRGGAVSPDLPPDFFHEPPDAEIEALATCLRALLPLDMSARSRVLEYLDDRLQAGFGATPADIGESGNESA